MPDHDPVSMSDQPDLAPSTGLPPAGSTLMVAATDAPTATVVVERAIDDHVVAVVGAVRVPTGAATVRWFDPAQATLEAEVVITEGADPTRVHLRLSSPWRDTDGRRSQRFEARYPMPSHVLQTVDNYLVPNLRLDLVCLDLSTTGMRAAYHGRPPGLGELIEIAMGTANVRPKPVMARVTRIDLFPFRRSELGLTFVFDASRERRHVMTVRDDLAARGSIRATAV